MNAVAFSSIASLEVLFTMSSCHNSSLIDSNQQNNITGFVFGYWYSSLHMAAQQTDLEMRTRRSLRNLSMFYSNDNFIVLLLCSDGYFLSLLCQFIGSTAKHKKQIIETELRNFSGKSMWQKEQHTNAFSAHNGFYIFHSWDEICAINYMKI